MYKIIGADGREYGPVSLEILKQWVAEGRANAETRILPENTAEWKKLGELPEFAMPGPGAAPARPAATPAPITALASAPRTNSLAITGLVLGIISITIGLCCYGLPFNIVGAICSAIGLTQIRKDPQRERGEGIAIAGLILSALSLVLAVVLFVIYLSFGSSGFLHRMRRF